MRGKLLYNNDSTSVFPDIKKGIAYDHLYFKFGKRPEDRTFKKVYVWINWETGLLCNIRKEFSLDNDSIEFSSASKSNLSKIETLKLFIGLGASLVIRNFHLKVGYLGSFNNMWLYEKDGTVPMKFFNSVNVTVSVPIKQSKIYAYRYQ